jgi:hypothetical protein
MSEPSWLRTLAASLSNPGPFNGLDSLEVPPPQPTQSRTMVEESEIDFDD